jgi:thiamine-phosphate pyrophosphorylase
MHWMPSMRRPSGKKPECSPYESNELKIDYSLYLVTDRLLARGRSIEEIVRKSIAGGVTVVQLREKNAGTRDFLDQAFALKQATSESGIPLIINDRVDIALACEADGVHLGQEDMHCRLARRIAGNDMIIGVSVSTLDEARAAEAEGADYLGVGPIFATLTKADALPPTGLDLLREIRRAIHIPLVGIGGISPDNAGRVIRSGADGVAVVSAIIAHPQPESAAKQLRSVIEEARASRPTRANI